MTKKDGQVQQESCPKRDGGRRVLSKGALLCQFKAPAYDYDPGFTGKEVLFVTSFLVDGSYIEICKCCKLATEN
jgi:hypothetical protein